jgi:protein TonB
MSAYARHDTGFFSRRAILFIAVALFHVLIFYIFQSGLATRIVHAVAPPMETTIEQDVKQHDLPPPPPPPKMEHPPVEVPPPDVVIQLPPEPTSTAITNTTTQHVPPPPPAVHVAVRTNMQVIKQPDPQDYYPPTSIRLEEEGVATVRFCWGPDSNVTGTPTVAKSSGSPRLDEAAVHLAAHYRIKAPTVDGKSIEGCTTVPVRFTLKD